MAQEVQLSSVPEEAPTIGTRAQNSQFHSTSIAHPRLELTDTESIRLFFRNYDAYFR